MLFSPHHDVGNSGAPVNSTKRLSTLISHSACISFQNHHSRPCHPFTLSPLLPSFYFISPEPFHVLPFIFLPSFHFQKASFPSECHADSLLSSRFYNSPPRRLEMPPMPTYNDIQSFYFFYFGTFSSNCRSAERYLMQKA